MKRLGQLKRATVVRREAICSKFGTPAGSRVDQRTDHGKEPDRGDHSPGQPAPLVYRPNHGNDGASDAHHRERPPWLTT